MAEKSTLIIGISGFANVGKDTVRNWLVERHGFTGLAFADRVRQLAQHLDPYFPELGETYTQLVARLGYDVAKRQHKCVRDYLIKIGHGCRTIIHGDIWVDALLHPSKVEALQGKRIVLSDVRYPNEAKRIHELGGVVIRVVRPGCDGVDPTEIESLAKTEYDIAILNDSTLENFQRLIDIILRVLQGDLSYELAENDLRRVGQPYSNGQILYGLRTPKETVD
jgi:hypothetical protein